MYVSMCSRMNIRVCLSVYSVFVYGCMRVCDLYLCMVLFAVCLCYACVVGICLYFRAALCAWPVWFLGCGYCWGLWVVPGFVSLWCGRLGTPLLLCVLLLLLYLNLYLVQFSFSQREW